MQTSDVPANFPVPFANAAGVPYIAAIPQASQIGVTAGKASLTDGFPPLTMTDLGAGGTWPFGQDFNGILKWSTDAIRWMQAGYFPKYDATFSTAIGGYPLNAVLLRGDGAGLWRSTTENNTSNPDTGGANWVTLGIQRSDFTGSFGSSAAWWRQAPDGWLEVGGTVSTTDFGSGFDMTFSKTFSVVLGITFSGIGESDNFPVISLTSLTTSSAHAIRGGSSHGARTVYWRAYGKA